MNKSEAPQPAEPLRLRYYLLATIALFVVAGLSWPIYNLIQHRAFRAQEERIEAIVETWRTPPPESDSDYWENGWGTVYNAIGNVCFTRDHVSLEEMERLYQDVRIKDAEPNSWERLEWLWYRLAKTGPHGRKYIDQMQPLWDDASAKPKEDEENPELLSL